MKQLTEAEVEANKLAVAILTAASTQQREAERGNWREAEVWGKEVNLLLKEFSTGSQDEIYTRVDALTGVLVGIFLPYCEVMNLDPYDVAEFIGKQVTVLGAGGQ